MSQQQQAFSGWVLPQAGGGSSSTVDQGSPGTQPWLVRNVSQLIAVAFDYINVTYVAGTQDIDTVVYKTGGPSGITVATVTCSYDGDGRLTGVTRTP